ncbi:MAG: glutamate synthase subunit alpha, partial [Deltaproteobacteria bacterium]|nr:glutamate synthase subunit alpha [Deltaproteobacteria bacterium]
MNREEIRKNAEEKGLYDRSFEHDSCGVGFIVHMKGKKSHDIIEKALLTLNHLAHRGACGCEENTGDGAGILIQIPHAFLTKVFGQVGVTLPEEGQYGVGTLFLPQDPAQQEKAIKTLEHVVAEEGQKFLGWRPVPVEASPLGSMAKSTMPVMRQFAVGLGEKGPNLPGPADDAWERRLFIIRKVFENAIRFSRMKNWTDIYIPSLSSRTLIYKGMLTSEQVGPYFPDLADPDMVTAIGLVHSRFSTNTFPNWELAHPFRYIAHNGEINTLRGNINWMRAREALFESPLFGKEMKKILPVVRDFGSDSAIFDNALEMLVMGGYSLPHAVMMMIPEAWSGHETMSQEKKDFYQYHATKMEPWDGPASIAFTDGRVMGAVLDRNGLRPSRYYVTKDDLVIMASEVGVIDVPPENVLLKGRLQPGKMFLIDLKQGRIIEDAELKHQ